MPQLDVSELLADPDFATRFSLTQRNETVSDGGLSVTTDTTTALVGVVTPLGGDALVRTEDGQHVPKGITVVARTRFRVASQNNQADIVTWKGTRFLVKKVDDYSEFGRGFSVAECEAMDLVLAV